MNIRIISSLTPDDEHAAAPEILRAVTDLLDQLPITYLARIETWDATTFENRGAHDSLDSPDLSRMAAVGLLSTRVHLDS